MDLLQLIRKPITAEMVEYREVFDQMMRGDNTLLQMVLDTIKSRTGKMMRPMLVLLSAKIAGELNRNSFLSAVTMEMLHTATLVHDDVVDESDERRGQPSIHKLYDNQIAVLVGDYMLALALQCVAEVGNPRLLSIMAEASKRLSSGELLQMDAVHEDEISEEVYFRIIKGKTAALFSACSEAGALSVTTDETVINTLKDFGETIGICFQIRDDIFDYNDDKSIGKPTGNDMKEGKLTLPVIYALKSTGNAEMIAIAHDVKRLDATDEQIARLVSFTKENGGIEYAQKVMFELADKAKSMLNIFLESDVKEGLKYYVDYVVDRKL